MRVVASRLIAFAALVAPLMVLGQQSPAAEAVKSTPVTKVLAIGHLVSPPSGNEFNSIMESEVRDTVRLYLSGKIDQWYVRKDQNGVVFFLNTTSLEDARHFIDGLPLVKAKLMQFELIPVGPLSPLGLLLTAGPAPAAQGK